MKKKYCDVGQHECEKLFHARTKDRLSSCPLHATRTPIKKGTKIGDYVMTSNKPRTEAKKPKTIPKVSQKQLDRLKAYKKVRDKYMAEHKHCEALIASVCTHKATELHHKAGRTGELLTNTDYFLAVCSGCHHFIETHPQYAKENGYSVDRLNK
jgi:hypothetical protein